ncbi:MAG: ABC transporter permease [Caldilineaceae bacterium]
MSVASTPRGPRPICNRWKRCATKAAAGQAKGILARWQPKFPQPLAAARTLISASGIGIGVATLVMLGGLVDGLIGELNSLAGSGGGNITVMQRDVADMSLSSLDERGAPSRPCPR